MRPDLFLRASKQNGVILDTNLFVLLVIGRVFPRQVGVHKKVSSYTLDDFQLVSGTVRGAARTIITPHIIAEISNHLVDKKPNKAGEINNVYFLFIKDILKFIEEKYVEKQILLASEKLGTLGFTDSSILETARKYKYAVLTEDFALAKILEKEKLPVMNINAIRMVRVLKGV
jgi:rRNA-processing protein FCF1